MTWLPSYGPEMRGGTASCTVIVADHEIGAPVADRIDVLIALNQPSLARFEPAVESHGLIVLNSSLVDGRSRRQADEDVVRVPASELARDAGDERMVGVVALGAALARRSIASVAAIMVAIRVVAGRSGGSAIAANEQAFLAGYLAGAGAGS